MIEILTDLALPKSKQLDTWHVAYLDEPLFTDSLTTLVAVSRSSERSGKSTELRWAEKRWYMEGSRRTLESQAFDVNG